MKSLNILFTGEDQVELCHEAVRPPGPDEVLVETATTLISTGTELTCLGRRFEPRTHWDQWVRYPFNPGYSLVGRITATGENVEGWHEGDRVAARLPHRQCVIAPADQVYPVPDGLSDEEATWFGLATIVQNGVRRAEHALGQTVVVIGLGLLGQLAVQYARLQGAREVIAVDPVERRLAMARGGGATTTLAMGAAEAREAVLEMTVGAGADVVYDVTGAASVFPVALGLLRRFGRLVLLGDTGTPSAQHLTADVIRNGLTIVGAHDSHPPLVETDHAPWTRQRMAALFFTFLQRGDMRVADLVTHRFAPTEASAVYRLLHDDPAVAMGVIFNWTDV